MNYFIKNATIVNEGKRFVGDVRITARLIAEIGQNLELRSETLVDATGKLLLPGVIDDQVHFREPGLTHKGEIYTEAKAAVAGGVTSFMEQPNTVPSATTIDLLEQKFSRASEVSLANFSFFMGTTNTNIEEIRRMDIRRVAGLKIFLGSSTGDMLVDNEETLETIFREVKTLIAVHAEDDPMIKGNMAHYVKEYGDNLNAAMHPLIRSREACLASSSKAVARAKKYGTRLHVFHISTADELALFDNTLPFSEKKITAEVCVHHLWFSDEDYNAKGNYIKWNPAVKSAHDREELWKALLDNRIDVIATDHAPHTIEEKEQPYVKAPSGGPLVQHSLIAMLEKSRQGVIPIERVVEKMSHAVADLFRIDKRGYIREGYYADLVLVDPNQSITVDKSNILYKCGWSPFEGVTFSHTVTHTWVNGHLVYRDGTFDESQRGMRLTFNR
ncbi:MAG: dihydroorotase [Bacteroidetes bacterium]|jgi:dihydroorotase|nr:dihydroorotase [Bacteroidota bacterium]